MLGAASCNTPPSPRTSDLRSIGRIPVDDRAENIWRIPAGNRHLADVISYETAGIPKDASISLCRPPVYPQNQTALHTRRSRNTPPDSSPGTAGGTTRWR